MPRIRFNRGIFPALFALTAFNAGAIESQLTQALWTPAGAGAPAAAPSAGDEAWIQNAKQFLSGRASDKGGFDAQKIVDGLIVLGVDAAHLSSAPRRDKTTDEKKRPRSLRPELAHSVCYLTHPEQKAQEKSLLITLPFCRRNIHVFASLLQNLRRTPLSHPVMLCTTQADDFADPYRALEELMHSVRTTEAKNPTALSSHFSHHLEVNGRSTTAQLNFAGIETVQITVTDRYVKWQNTQSTKTTAYGAVQEIQNALRTLPLAFKKDRFQPYVATHLSEIRCRRDWSSLLTSECTTTLHFSSRSKGALVQAREGAYAAAQTVIQKLNAASRTGARRDLIVSFPVNDHYDPQAEPASSALVGAWKRAVSQQPEAVLSARFIPSSAAVTAASGISSLALGDEKTDDETDGKDASTLEALLLTLTGD